MSSEYEETARLRRLREARVVVVIPFYNGSAFIERSARSVLEQTVPPVEFVVVDDGSTEEEARRLDAIAEAMGFRVLHKANGGQGSARNAGVAATSADFISFLDQDDFYLRNHIESLIDAMPPRDPHFGWVYGELFEAEGTGEIVRTSIVSRNSKNPKTSVYDLLEKDMFILPSASLIARTAFEAVSGFDEQFMGYEDDDLFLRLFRAGYTNHFTQTPVTVWCIHTESTSYGIRMARSRLKYFRKLTEAFPDDPKKGRFFIRDNLIPRFSGPILEEAIAAASGRGGKFTTFRDDYIAMAREYTDIVCATPSVPGLLKLRYRLRMKILESPRWHSLYRLHPHLNWFRARGRRTYRWLRGS